MTSIFFVIFFLRFHEVPGKNNIIEKNVFFPSGSGGFDSPPLSGPTTKKKLFLRASSPSLLNPQVESQVLLMLPLLWLTYL